jgi:hypothetical protein
VDLVLPLIGLVLLLLTGAGLLFVILPAGRTVGFIEACALAVVLGCAGVSLLSFGLSLFVWGRPAQALAITCCLGICVLGVSCWRRRGPSISREWQTGTFSLLLMASLVLQTGLVALAVLRSTFVGDGLFVWEWKARMFCLREGSLPVEYYTAPAPYGHPEYPLLLPLTEAWLYAWAGRCDQGLARAIFPLFYLAAIGLLYAGATRLSGQPRVGLLTAIMLFFVPFVSVGAGSLSSGYADVLLGVYYLATAMYILEYIGSGAPGALRLASVSAVSMLWLKREGVLLWLCAMAILSLVALRRGEKQALRWTVLPGCVGLALWQLFLVWMGTSPVRDFDPFTLETLLANRGRIVELNLWVIEEFTIWSRWGLLWPALGLALLLPGRARPRAERLALAGLLIPPLLIETNLYVFSYWDPYLRHVEVSLPRLMLQLAPVGILAIGLSMPRLFGPGEQWDDEAADVERAGRSEPDRIPVATT